MRLVPTGHCCHATSTIHASLSLLHKSQYRCDSRCTGWPTLNNNKHERTADRLHALKCFAINLALQRKWRLCVFLQLCLSTLPHMACCHVDSVNNTCTCLASGLLCNPLQHRPDNHTHLWRGLPQGESHGGSASCWSQPAVHKVHLGGSQLHLHGK